MEMQLEKEKCENCDLLIDSSKFSLHEAYCYRNFIKCPECKEPIDKKELKIHEEENHRMIECKDCSDFFSKNNEKNHKLICSKRPKLCNFCNLEVPFNNYTDHVHTCSSRTKKCQYCNKNITLRDFEYHESKCSFPTFQESNNKAEELKINQDKLDEEFAKRLQEELYRMNSANSNNNEPDIHKNNNEPDVHKKRFSSPTKPIDYSASPGLMKKEDKKDNSFEEYFDNIHDEVINNTDNHLLEGPDLNHQISSDDPNLQKALYDSLNNK